MCQEQAWANSYLVKHLVTQKVENILDLPLLSTTNIGITIRYTLPTSNSLVVRCFRLCQALSVSRVICTCASASVLGKKIDLLPCLHM